MHGLPIEGHHDTGKLLQLKRRSKDAVMLVDQGETIHGRIICADVSELRCCA
jgi:hypothetical protein